MKKYYNWIKSNWILIVLLIATTFFVWRLYRFNDTYEILFQENVKQSEQFHKQLEILENLNKELERKQALLEMNYKKEIKEIKNEYDIKLDELSKFKKNTQIKIIKDASKDPASVAKMLEELYGIPVGSR